MINQYDVFMSMGDPRVAEWPLMQSPWPSFAISGSYILMAVIVPRILKGRKIPGVYYPVLIYNFLCVLMNCWLVYELMITTSHYSWKCQPVDYSTDEYPVRTAAALWWFYFTKIFEMLDTVFFICKGNYRQITFLHVYHHSTIFLVWWMGVKYVAGGNAVFGAMINSAIHVIMYTYYFLAAFGPQLRPYLWWKKHLTALQLVQFAFNFVQAFVVWHVDCGFPKEMYYWFICYIASFLLLFGNFYRQSYIKKPKAENGYKRTEVNNNDYKKTKVNSNVEELEKKEN